MHSAAVGDPFCDTNQAYRSLVCYVLFGHDPSLQGLFAKESPAHCWLQFLGAGLPHFLLQILVPGPQVTLRAL